MYRPGSSTRRDFSPVSRWWWRVALVLLALGVSAISSSAQISPGPLSKAHQSLSGTSQCASCHQFGASEPTFKCLDCHKEIARLLSDKQGYHANLGMQNPNGKDCVRCHLEHNGVDFHLIHWDKPIKEFDHRLTGYPLEGKHASVGCEKCHISAHMRADVRTLLKRANPAGSYLGLSMACISCHEDYHKGQLGKDCQTCHNVSDWKAARNFDHSKTRYPLTGLHIQVACEKCHQPGPSGGPARFKDMKFASCSNCHIDPHRGAFPQRCEECHTASGWKRVASTFAIDHSKTKFPLLGEHAKVSCLSCHARGDFKKPLSYEHCMDCHKDEHSGQFVDRARKGECAECHTVNGWKPSLFGVKEHATSKYSLEGKHTTVDCAKCHVPAGKETRYKIKFANCTDCHQDAHDGQFAGPPHDNRCEECHTVRDFHLSLFTIASHEKSRFLLTGAHLAVPCNQCHTPEIAHRTDKVLPFHFADRSCTACHQDPHHGEFRERTARLRADGTPFGCEACHSTRSWTDVNGFDHSKTEFPLLGAHRTVACGQCHKPLPGKHDIQFKGTSKECESCHTEPHGGQFKNHAEITPCTECHNTLQWVPSTFEHDKRTKFPLQGGHEKVRCSTCHKLTEFIAGRPILFYKPTPTKCEACHGPGTKR